MRIQYFCHYSDLTGFGRAARDYALALTAAGAELDIVDWRSYPGNPDAGVRPRTPEPRYGALDDLVRPWARSEASAPDLVLAHGKPQLLAEDVIGDAIDRLWPGCDHPIVAMTTWETSAVPDVIARGLARYDAVLVPSDFVADVFGHAFAIAGHPVHIIPHCFDPSFWPGGAGWGAQRWTPGSTTFYTHGAWSERKNHFAIVRSFLHAFHGNEDVSLAICSQDGDGFQLQSMILRSGLATGIPNVRVHREPLDEEGLLSLHEASDVFVTMTRGEGWGLPIFEAAIMGRPILAPACGGHLDFLMGPAHPHPDAGWHYSGWKQIRHRMTPCFAGEPALIFEAGRPVGMRASMIAGMDCRQEWADPDVLEMAAAMRNVHFQRQHGNARVSPGDRKVLERRFGYAPVAKRLLTTLQEILSL